MQKISSRETLFESSNMQEAAAAFKEKVDGPFKAVSLEFSANEATLRVLDPKQPDHLNDYVYSKGFCSGPRPVPLNQLELGLPRDKDLFALDEIDFAVTPQVVKAALARTNIEGGKVSKITIHRGIADLPGDSSDHYITKWTIDIAGPRESASAIANAKDEIIGVDLSRTTRGEKQDYFSPQALADAVKHIKQRAGVSIRFSRQLSVSLVYGCHFTDRR